MTMVPAYAPALIAERRINLDAPADAEKFSVRVPVVQPSGELVVTRVGP